ncbi:MAG TPA: glycosyltransferase family 39 protein [bacterium]|nr:glycosyltransferase family 39 protein [bacterium]
MRSKAAFWVFVTLLIAANTALAYGGFPPVVTGWVFVAGFLVPTTALFLKDLSGALSFRRVEKKPAPSTALLALVSLILLGAVPRFWRLTEDFLWPTGDEGLHGFLAMGLARHWTGQFFYTVGEHPPLLIWSLALMFKAGWNGLTALWCLPAFFSLILIPVGYGAARRWFDRKWSLVFVFLLAISYWPLSLGRYCHQGLFVPFWELVALWGIGELAEGPRVRWHGWDIFLLGLWIGLGTLTFTAWWAVLFGATCLWLALFNGRGRMAHVAYYSGLLLGILPFLIAAFREGYGHHLLDSSPLNPGFGPSHLWITRLSYITSLFWGSLQAGTSYGPLWGGMLNPILSTAFWVGLAALIQDRASGKSKITLFFLFICLLPGLLAGDYVELNRIIQVMPWVLWTCVVGLRAVLSRLKADKTATVGLCLILAVSTALDGWHYLKPVLSGERARIEKASFADGNEGFLAYRTLQGVAKSQGPGIVLTDFMPLKFGHSLSVAVHSFNAAENDRLDPQACSWAALVTEVQLVPFLRSRFPKARWFWFHSVPPALEGGMALGLIPIGERDRKWISDLIAVHHSFHRLNLEAERSFNGPQYFKTALEDTWDLYPRIKGDRYLETVFWEWVSQFNLGSDPSISDRVLVKALERGYPTADLLEKLSRYKAQEGKTKEVEEFHARALEALREVQEIFP